MNALRLFPVALLLVASQARAEPELQKLRRHQSQKTTAPGWVLTLGIAAQIVGNVMLAQTVIHDLDPCEENVPRSTCRTPYVNHDARMIASGTTMGVGMVAIAVAGFLFYEGRADRLAADQLELKVSPTVSTHSVGLMMTGHF
jgi:hypothetical protein